MAFTINSPESFGIFPGDPAYDTFDTDFPEPENDTRVHDYSNDAFEFGQVPANGSQNGLEQSDLEDAN